METLLTACPADLIPADDRQLIIRDLLLDLHDKVSEHVWCNKVKLSTAIMAKNAFYSILLSPNLIVRYLCIEMCAVLCLGVIG